MTCKFGGLLNHLFLYKGLGIHFNALLDMHILSSLQNTLEKSIQGINIYYF